MPNLLRVSRDIGVVQHIKLDILQGCALGDLPVNGADISRRVGKPDVNLEIPDTPQKVILINVPCVHQH